jgi:hypothetical protein
MDNDLQQLQRFSTHLTFNNKFLAQVTV